MSNGHHIDDIKYRYTIDQVYRFYEECRKSDLDEQRDLAITVANCLIFASPSSSKGDISKKKRAWDKFMDGLDWDKLTSKDKKTTIKVVKDIASMFGIPILGKLDEEVKE